MPSSSYWIRWPFDRQFNCYYKRIQTAKPIPTIPKPWDGDGIGFYPSSCLDKIPKTEHYQWQRFGPGQAKVLFLYRKKWIKWKTLSTKILFHFWVWGLKWYTNTHKYYCKYQKFLFPSHGDSYQKIPPENPIRFWHLWIIKSERCDHLSCCHIYTSSDLRLHHPWVTAPRLSRRNVKN